MGCGKEKLPTREEAAAAEVEEQLEEMPGGKGLQAEQEEANCPLTVTQKQEEREETEAKEEEKLLLMDEIGALLSVVVVPAMAVVLAEVGVAAVAVGSVFDSRELSAVERMTEGAEEETEIDEVRRSLEHMPVCEAEGGGSRDPVAAGED